MNAQQTYARFEAKVAILLSNHFSVGEMSALAMIQRHKHICARAFVEDKTPDETMPLIYQADQPVKVAKHTAGEWTLTIFKEGDYGVTDGDGGDLIAEGIEKIEDAKLIAAAPRMLEQLKQAHAFMCHHIPMFGQSTSAIEMRKLIDEASGE